MSSSSPQKLTFSSFKKDKASASASNPSPPPSEIRIKTAGPLPRFALKFFIVFNLGFSVYLFSLKPLKRKKSPDVAVTVDSNATGFNPDELPPSSTHSPAAPS